MSKALEAFGKYLLLEKLAAGGMAEVFLAKSVGAGGIGKFVAMKRILPQFTDNEEFVEMFKEEAKLVMNLNHGNIVSIFDFGIERNQFFLIMEYVEGQNLRQTLNHLKKTSRNFSIDQIVYIVKEVAAGLDHAHRCVDASTGKLLNITHRDISPQNIMLSFEGEIKVVDFGIAKAETQLEHTRAGTIKGKFGYMSPEQAEGQLVDAKTDIFSLGIVLWELLAGERLFSAQSEQATLRKIKECQVPSIRKLNPSVHIDLEKIVQKSLERDKTNRYQSMESFTKDLSKFLNTHFPEFSKQEFSKFMKSSYSDMYLENRKKLAEFAKIDSIVTAQAQSASEKTVITQTYTNTATEKIADKETDHTETEEKSELIDRGLISEAPNQKVDLKKFALDQKKPITAVKPKQNFYTTTQPQVRSGTVSTGTYSGTSKSIHIQQQSSNNWISALLVLVLFAGGGYWYYQNQNKIKRTEASLAVQEEGAQSVETPYQNASQGTVPLSINSTPSEAKIYIDDVYVGDTPYRSHVAANRIFRVRLIKPGYIPYDLLSEKANPDGYHKIVSLLPEAASGWIQVEAISAEPQAYLVINERKLNQNIQDEIKVPAGSMITVKVINPISKMEGSQTIVVGAGERKRVRILINRAAQITP